MIIGTPINSKTKAGTTPSPYGGVSPEDYLGDTTQHFGGLGAKQEKVHQKDAPFFLDSPHAGGTT